MQAWVCWESLCLLAHPAQEPASPYKMLLLLLLFLHCNTSPESSMFLNIFCLSSNMPRWMVLDADFFPCTCLTQTGIHFSANPVLFQKLSIISMWGWTEMSEKNVNYKWDIIHTHVYFGAACPYLFLLFIYGYQKHQKNARNAMSHWSSPDGTFRATHGNSCTAYLSWSRKLYTAQDNARRHRPTRGPRLCHGGNRPCGPLGCLCAQESCLSYCCNTALCI